MIASRRPPAPRPPLSVGEAAAILSRLADTVERLTGVVAEETRLVRAGSYDAARALEAEKGALSSRYMLDVGAVSGAGEAIAAQPQEDREAVERLHVAFRAALDENLAVLGTARSVAESLLRGVSEEIGGRSAPKTYDARGGAYAKPAAAPMALSRTS